MEKKSEKSPTPAEVKKQLEALTGKDLNVPEELFLKLWYPAGTYSYNEGFACWRNFFLPFPGRKSCSEATLLDVSGASSTAADGRLIFQISQFVCFPQVHALAEPISVVATPRASGAFFLTQTHALVNNDTDIEISVYTWDAAGNAAPNIAFDWRCRAVNVPIIL